MLFECDIYNAHFHQEDVFRNIEALAGYLAIYACLMFEFANFIDKGHSHKSHYHKTSKTTYKRVKANSAKSDSTGDKCNKVFINNALKWYHVLIYSKML